MPRDRKSPKATAPKARAKQSRVVIPPVSHRRGETGPARVEDGARIISRRSR